MDSFLLHTACSLLLMTTIGFCNGLNVEDDRRSDSFLSRLREDGTRKENRVVDPKDEVQMVRVRDGEENTIANPNDTNKLGLYHHHHHSSHGHHHHHHSSHGHHHHHHSSHGHHHHDSHHEHHHHDHGSHHHHDSSHHHGSHDSDHHHTHHHHTHHEREHHHHTAHHHDTKSHHHHDNHHHNHIMDHHHHLTDAHHTHHKHHHHHHSDHHHESNHHHHHDEHHDSDHSHHHHDHHSHHGHHDHDSHHHHHHKRDVSNLLPNGNNNIIPKYEAPISLDEKALSCPKPNGSFQLKSHCGFFFICVEGKISGPFSCPKGMSFDEEKETCTSSRKDCQLA